MIRLGVYLILTGTTWYLAGMYRSFPLTLLFLSEALLLCLLAVQSVLFRVTVSAGFPDAIRYAEKNLECRCRVFLRQKSIFPAGRVRLTLALYYDHGRRKLTRHLFGAVGPRGESGLEFFIRPKFCGPVTVELSRWRVYDFLSLFPAGRRGRDKMTVIVLPRPVSLRIQNAPPGEAWAGPYGGADFRPRQEPSADFRDLREYRPGDSARAIHWKQSARTGNLWVREYEREIENFFTLCLDRSGHLSPEKRDAFYEILSAIILGLLEHAAAVRVYWREGGQSRCLDITGEDGRRDLFRRLYLSEPEAPRRRDADADENITPVLSRGGAFYLDTDLRWRRNRTCIYQFSRSDFRSEIAERIFYI